MKLHHRAYLLAALFVMSASTEIASFALGREWPKFTSSFHVLQLILSALWLVAAFGLVRRASWAPFPLLLATLSAFFYGWSIMVAADRLPALLFIVTGLFGAISYRKLALPWRESMPFLPFSPAEREDRTAEGEPLPGRHVMA